MNLREKIGLTLFLIGMTSFNVHTGESIGYFALGVELCGMYLFFKESDK